MDSSDFSARRRYPAVAAVAALSFFIVATVLGVAGGVVAVVYMQGQTLESLDGFDYALPALGQALPNTVTYTLPLAVGLFVSFWGIAPLRPGIGLAGAVGRTLVAMLVGLIIATVVYAAIIIGNNQSALNPPPGQEIDNRYILLVVAGIAQNAWTTFADTLGLALAAGLGAWGWLVRNRSVPVAPGAAAAPVESAATDTV